MQSTVTLRMNASYTTVLKGLGGLVTWLTVALALGVGPKYRSVQPCRIESSHK